MPKRTNEEKIKRYKKKLRKLEGKNTTRRIILSDSETSDEPQDLETTEAPLEVPQDETFLDEFSENEASNEQVDLPIEFSDIDPSILEALGDDNVEDPEFGEKIYEDLLKRWLPLVKKGLPKETKEKLLKEYLVPENLKLLQAPSLNPELATALAEHVKSRDKKLRKNQQQLSSGISAANRALQILLQDGDKIEAVKHLSNCCRVLLDLHALETKWRRIIVTTSLDKSFYQIVQDSERDDTLFCADLFEKIKMSNNSEKLGFQFKMLPAKKSNFQPATKNQGNGYRPRLSSNRGGRGGYKRTPAPPPRRYPPASSRAWPPPPPPPPAYPSTSRSGAPTHQ